MLRFLWIFLFIVLGCQSKPPVKQAFQELKLGALKGDVLETMGSPVRSTRKKGVDRWYYYLTPEASKSIRVLHFKKGVLVYKGEPVKPLLTADEMEEIKQQYKHQGQGKKIKPFKRSVSDKQLKKIIKKEIKGESKKNSRFEEL